MLVAPFNEHLEGGKQRGKPKRVLPGQAKGGKSRDFRSAAGVDNHLEKLSAEILSGIVATEQPHDLITAGTQRQTTWLSRLETPENGKVKARSNLSPETAPKLFGGIMAPGPVLTLGEFAFRVAAEHAEA
jgi:hypothetical protein